MRAHHLVPTILLLTSLSLACADRTTVPLDSEGETGSPLPGEPFSDCSEQADCDDEWCLRPANEPGFCTYACSSAGVESCEPISGGTATPTCLPVEADQVCALDCAGNKSCPPGMRCEQIQSNDEARSICF